MADKNERESEAAALEPECETQAAPLPCGGRRRLKILPALAIAFVLIYSAVWYFLGKQAENELTSLIGKAAEDGVDIRCPIMQKSGYPLRINIGCNEFAVNMPQAGEKISPLLNEAGEISAQAREYGQSGIGGGGFAFHSAGLTAGAPVYAPHWLSVELKAPASLKLPFQPEIKGAWQKLLCAGDFTAAQPHNISLMADRPSIGNLPFLAENAGLSADFIRFDSKNIKGDKAAFRFSFDNMSLPLKFVQNQNLLPKADGLLDIVFDNAGEFYADMRQFLQNRDLDKLRGKSGRLNSAFLMFENGGGFTLSGPFSVAADGRLSGKIAVEVNDSSALLRTIRLILPEQADNLESLFFMLNAMPKNEKGNPLLQFDIDNGRARMGFLKLGKIPPL